MHHAVRHATIALLLAVITLMGAWLRVDNLGIRSFSVDEVLHVFAARSLNDTGRPTLPGGEPYHRAYPVTWAVAAAFARFGESEAAARLPIAVAGVATIPAVFALGAALFGPATGLAAAFLLAASPDAVAMSRFVRMYAPAQLLVVLAALAIWVGLEARRAVPAWAWLAAGGLLLAAAATLHPQAFGFLPPLALYVAALAAARGASGGWRAAARAPATLALAAGTAGALLVLAVAPDPALRPLRVALTRLPWFPAESWDPRFYHWYLGTTYSYLWFLAPAATVFALVAAGRAGAYVACLFWVPFLAISTLVATQSPRYVFLLLPFLFVLVGEAGLRMGGFLWRGLVARLCEVVPRRRLVLPVAALIFVGTLAAVVRGSSWFAAAQSNRLKASGEFSGALYEEWREAAAFVRATADPNAVVAANADHLALYYLGRIDGRLLYTYQAPHPGDHNVERTPHGWRFRSYRTGTPSFSDAADLEAFVEEHPHGVLVIERRHLGAYPSVFAPGVDRVLAARLSPHATPADGSLAVFSWDSPARAAQARPTTGP